MLDRIDQKRKMAIQSMNGDGKINPALSSPLANKDYGASSYGTKSFSTAAYGGTKSAELKTFSTKSFLGIRNPWFGKTTYATNADREGKRVAKESAKQYETDAFAVSNYEKGRKKDLLDTDAVLPDSARPRTYLGPGKRDKSEGVDKFTQNLSKDLSIDDVRDLLNKGKGE